MVDTRFLNTTAIFIASVYAATIMNESKIEILANYFILWLIIVSSCSFFFKNKIIIRMLVELKYET